MTFPEMDNIVSILLRKDDVRYAPSKNDGEGGPGRLSSGELVKYAWKMYHRVAMTTAAIAPKKSVPAMFRVYSQ